MPGLFSEFTLKDVRLRNRVAVSPMTQYSCGPDGAATDWHLVHLGARAIGGAGLVVVEQAAVSPEGRMTAGCLGLWNDDQIEPLARIARFIKQAGAAPGIQLGHSGRKGSISKPWHGYSQLPPDHPDAWEPIGPSENAYGGRFPRGARAMSRDDIHDVEQKFANAAQRALAAGFEWVELHYAHGFLGASFFSPIANKRRDDYGGSRENRARFLVETFDRVRAVWPERLPLTMRIGAVDFHPESHTMDDTVELVRTLKARGLDLVDISMGMNTEEASVPFGDRGFMIPFAESIRRHTGVPTATSWNLADPTFADQIIREGLIDLLMIGRPTLSNPHWPYYAALVVGENAPLDLIPDQYRYFLKKAEGVPHASGFGPALTCKAR
jgi:2,4-dienoyl-CoA reductase-like NADH-dependent reductase (Old Yellow Enzyme family)